MSELNQIAYLHDIDISSWGKAAINRYPSGGWNLLLAHLSPWPAALRTNLGPSTKPTIQPTRYKHANRTLSSYLSPSYAHKTPLSRRLVCIVIATRVAKLPSTETGTGDAKRSQTIRLAAGAASVLVFADFQLHIVWAPATSLIFAAFFVNLIRFVVVALQADQALEAHLEGFWGLWDCQSVGMSKSRSTTTYLGRQSNNSESRFLRGLWHPLCPVHTIGPVTQARRRPHRSGPWRW